METANALASYEADIRELINCWAKALRAKDVDGVMALYAADIVSFDLAPPLQYVGAERLRQNLDDWFPTFIGPIGYEIADLSITVGGAVGFCRSLNRLNGMRTGGENTDVWFRATVCCRKIEDKWMIVHEHTSVPLYMDGTGRAAIDLKP